MPAKQEPNIGINYGWAGGESGINLQLDENWRAIGALLQLSVISKTTDVPETPSAGDRYIVPTGATGDWSDLGGKVVRYNEDSWEVYTPLNGWLAFVVDEDLFHQFDGTVWKDAPFLTASNVSFDPSDTTLSSTNIQAAFKELDTNVSAGGVVDGGVQTTKLADYSYDSSASTGFTFAYRGGRLQVGSTVVSTPAGTVELDASTTNYVEVDGQGVVTSNSVGFSNGQVPLYSVVTGSSDISTMEDRRAWLNLPGESESQVRPGVNNQTGTGYVLTLSDDNTVVRCANTDPVTVTVPTEASVAFPVGSIVQIRQVDVGQVTLDPETGVTLGTPETLKTRKQGSTIGLMKVGTDEWDVTGDMEAAS